MNRGIAAAVLGLVGSLFLAVGPADAVSTDGTVTCKVTTVTANGSYAPKHVLAIWVLDVTNRLVQSQMHYGRTRQQYLYTWINNVAGYTNVNGTTGSTLSSHGTRTVVWNCRDRNNVVVPDGTYTFRVEFTEKNGQGPVTSTNYIRFYKGTTAFSTNYTNLANFQNIQVGFAPVTTPHDIAVTRLTAPSIANPGSNVAVTVFTSNKTSTAESFALTLSNRTANTLIGSQAISSMAGNTVRTNTFVWDTTGLGLQAYTLVATAGPVSNESATVDNSLTAVVTLRDPYHDLDVRIAGYPPFVPPGVSSNVTVSVTNLGDFAETFTCVLTNLSAPQAIGSRTVAGLAAYGGVTNMVFAWNTTGISPGVQTLRASVAPVSGETMVDDNTNQVRTAIATGLTTNTVIGAASVWKYNDKGLNLHNGPWTSHDYYDAHWPSGAAPFGYGSLLITTTNAYGTNSASKYPCYYYRREVLFDVVPMSITARVRRDDGFILYVNGSAAAMENMDIGIPVAYSNLANATVDSTGNTNYFVHALDPGYFETGRNQLAVEVHQSAPNSSDVAFDLQLSVVTPTVPLVHDVAVQSVAMPGSALAGDILPVTVRVANPGQAAETFSVSLVNTNTATSLGTKSAGTLAPGEWKDVMFDWNTAGAAAGIYGLRASIPAVAGETNTANNLFTGAASIAGSVFVYDPVEAAGSIGGFARCTALSGTRLYVGEGATLTVLSLAAPAAPVVLGRLRLPGVVEGLAVSGDTVFAAAGAAGVHVVNATTPSNMTHQTTFDSAGHAHRVAVSGTRLYIADGPAGVRVLDVTTPASPTLLGGYASSGPVRALAVSGSTVYALDHQEGLLVLNMASPASSTMSGQLSTLTSGEDIALNGTTACVVDGNSALSLVDVSGAPALRGQFRLAGPPRGLALSGSTAFVAAEAGGLDIVNIATPTSPARLGTLALGDEASGVAVSGSYAYLAAGYGGVITVNAGNPAAPASLGPCDSVLLARGAAVTSNGVAFVAAGSAGLRAYDVSVPSRPVLIGSNTNAVSARDVALNGAIAIVADGGSGVKTFDVSNPSNLVFRSSYTNAALTAVHAVSASGGAVAVADLDTVQGLTVDASGGIAAGASYTSPATVHDIDVASGRVLVAAGASGLRILDAATMLEVGLYDTAGFATGVSGSGIYAYVADGAGGWLTLNLTTPASPVLVGSWAAQGQARSLAAAGSLVQIASDTAVSAMVATNPVTPVEKNRFSPLVRALRMAAAGPYAYTMEDEAGMGIFDVAPDDHDLDGMSDAAEGEVIDADPEDAIRTVEDVRPEDDFDEDGFTNLQESIAGTGLADASSRFAILNAGPGVPGSGAFVISWKSVSSRVYSVHRSTNLLQGFDLVQDNIPATPPLNLYTNTTAASPAAFLIQVR